MSPKIEKIKPIIKEMDINELEELFLISNYFQEFEKKELKNIEHNKELVNDIIEGLKKASIYEN